MIMRIEYDLAFYGTASNLHESVQEGKNYPAMHRAQNPLHRLNSQLGDVLDTAS